MSTYFFLIFQVHYTIFKYNVSLEEYMDLSPRLISGTKSHIPLNFRIGYNLALTKNSDIYYSRGTVYVAIVNTAELRMVLFFCINCKMCKGTSNLHI